MLFIHDHQPGIFIGKKQRRARTENDLIFPALRRKAAQSIEKFQLGGFRRQFRGFAPHRAVRQGVAYRGGLAPRRPEMEPALRREGRVVDGVPRWCYRALRPAAYRVGAPTGVFAPGRGRG